MGDDYNIMLGDLSEHWGQTPEGLEDIMDTISHHESKGENVYQTGGGPGAGFFQYETGKGQGGMTARNRLAKWFGDKALAYPCLLNKEGMDDFCFDASLLDKNQQRMLFLADKRYHPTASMNPDSTSNLAEWWAKNHWAGGKEGSDIYKTRVSSFNRDLNEKKLVDDVTTEQGSDAF